MTTHSAPVDLSQDQPPLPNQHFSSWLRGQTTLFVGQIVAILTFVLFVAEEIYYISHAGEKGELLEPLTIKLIIDIAHIVFLVVFVLVVIKFLDDNDRGSHRVGLVFHRVFKEKIDKDRLEKSQEQLKRFKFRFLWFWIGMLALYVCFACQHGNRRATCESSAKPVSHANVVFSTVTTNSEGKHETFKTETDYERSEPGARCNEASSLEPLTGSEVRKHLMFPFVVFVLNNFTLFILFLCFLVVYIPEAEMKRYRWHWVGALAVVVVLTAAFPVLAKLFANDGFTRAEWDAYSAIFDSLSGVANAIVLALLIARLDSKLVGLPSWLISILYSYAAAQPLFVVFELNQTEVFEKITTAVLIFVFVAKIYFFLIVTYAMQTGKLLNYLCCFPILHERVEQVSEDDPKSDAKSTGGLLSHNFLLTVSGVIGLLAIVLFVGLLIWCVLDQPGPMLFGADDFKDLPRLASKLRDEINPLSRHLRDQFSPETQRQLELYNYNSQPSPLLTNGLVEGLNRAIKDPTLYDERAFAQLSLTKEINTLIEQKPHGNALVAHNRLLLEAAYTNEIASTNKEKNLTWSRFLDGVQLLVILCIIVVLCRVLKKNDYGDKRTRAIMEEVFKDHFKIKDTPEDGKEQLRKFKRYFLYFWCAMFVLYVIFLLKHSQVYFWLSDVDPTQSKIRILLYPFLEFSFSSLNSLFIFWCFVLLRSPAFDERVAIRQRLLINYSTFVTALLVAAFPLLLFVVGGLALSGSSLRDYATIFDGVAGTLSAIVWALLIARMNSKLFTLSAWPIAILFTYAAIQPLFVVFPLNDVVLENVQTVVLITALMLKVCFFLIIVHTLQSGKALNYVVCFPFLKERVESILENQFEIRLARAEGKFTFSILKKNQLRYSTTVRCETRQECDDLVHYLRIRMGISFAYTKGEEAGTYWVKVRSAGPRLLLCESIPLRSEKEAHDLIEESVEKIPYCKYNRT
jgi:hypothetical protein